MPVGRIVHDTKAQEVFRRQRHIIFNLSHDDPQTADLLHKHGLHELPVPLLTVDFSIDKAHAIIEDLARRWHALIEGQPHGESPKAW